jgi:hypothetical protein
MFDFPTAGYYHTVQSPFDLAGFLKFYPDGFWVYQDSFDFEFDFPKYVESLDVDSLKQRYPDGTCLRDEQLGKSSFRSSCGRYKRVADLPMIAVDGREVGRMPDALVLTCGSSVSAEIEIIGNGRLENGILMAQYEFVPDGVTRDTPEYWERSKYKATGLR